MEIHNRKKYSRLYNLILREWETPEHWFEDDNKTFYLETWSTDCYWVIWSMLKSCKLPDDFIKKITFNRSQAILKNTLIDFNQIFTAAEKMKKMYTKYYYQDIFLLVLKICLWKNTNEYKKIKVEDISDAYESEIIEGTGDRTKLSLLLYYTGYTNKAYIDSKLFRNLEDSKIKLSEYWHDTMKDMIVDFIDDLSNSTNGSRKFKVDKISALNLFAEWYANEKNIEKIKDFLDFGRDTWLGYIKYIKEKQDISLKTKQHKLIALRQLVEWLDVKTKKVIHASCIIRKSDLISLSNCKNNGNLSFDKREYAEIIINYLMNDFKTNDISEMIKKEAVIIAANSGARISEIRRLEFDSCFYSEDEGLYKIILDYQDKVNRKNTPLYLTRQGYEAIKRVEELKKKYDILKPTWNERVGRQYVHLFEFRGKNVLNKTALSNFLNKIKKEAGLFDEDGNIVKGGMHAWRHFFAKTIFIESNYNISAVRYLLRHKSYQMSFRYLEEEKEQVFNLIRNNEENAKFSGAALDTLVDVFINNNSEYKNLKIILDKYESLYELIEFKEIEKTAFGYCLKPCENAKRCIRCKNFLLSKQDEDEILRAITELFELTCYKISMYKSTIEAFNNIYIQKDIADIMTLLEEIKMLGIDNNRIPQDLRKVVEMSEE